MNDSFYFIFFIVGFIFYRIFELRVAQRNEKKLKIKSGCNIEEVGQIQRKLMIILHSLWFVSLIFEFFTVGSLNTIPVVLLSIALLFISIFLRIHSMRELGVYWNTKIFSHSQKAPIIKTGLYKYFNQPNYLAVIIEFIAVPALFQCYYTLVFFLLFKIIFLKFRIETENIYLYSKEVL